jgi:hypothetical protein
VLEGEHRHLAESVRSIRLELLGLRSRVRSRRTAGYRTCGLERLRFDGRSKYEMHGSSRVTRESNARRRETPQME